MTNEEKLQDYEAKLELVKRHLEVDYKYLNLIGFEIELKDMIDYAKRIWRDNDGLHSDKRKLKDEVSDLECEIKDLKKEIKELKNKNLKNNEI